MQDNNFPSEEKNIDTIKQRALSLVADIRGAGQRFWQQRAFVIEYLCTHKEQGLKILIPLAVIGIGLYSCSSAQKNISRDIRDVFAISDEIRDFYNNKPDYWGLSSEVAVKQNILSSKFISNGKIVLGSKKEIFIGNGKNADVIMPGIQSFDIILPSLNKAQCISYTEASLHEDEQVKLTSITIINTAGEAHFEWGGENSLPVHRYASKDLCADASNTIIWSLK